MAGKFDVCAEVTQSILAQLEAGVVPWRQPWDAGGPVALPVRVTGEPYRGANVLLLWQRMVAKGYRHPRWMTYRQAAQLGGQVRKGETGTMVVKFGTAVKPGAADAESGAAETGAGETDRVLRYVRAYRVFNAAQIEGLDAAFYAEPLAPRSFGTRADPAVLAWLARTGIALEVTGEPRAYYSRARDVIHMPPAETFEDGAAHAGTLLHEAGHATGAAHRLDRTFGRVFGDAAYCREELVAELASAMVGARLGIAPRFEQNAAYLQGWISVLRSESRAILRAASAAQQAADWLMARGGEMDGTGVRAA